MNARSQQIISRIPETRTDLRKAALDCLDVADRFRTHASAVSSDAKLTELGRRQVLHDAALKEYLPALNIAQRPIASAAMTLRESRGGVSIAAPDPTNIAAALERQEIRAIVRGMRPAGRIAYLAADKDERIADAVLSAPAVLSGLSDEEFSKIRDAALERRFHDKITEIRAEEVAIAEANNALQIASQDIKRLIGVTDRQFAAMQRNGVEKPWLRQDGDKVVRIVPGETSARMATADDISQGKFYASYDEYLSDNPGAKDVRTAEVAA